MKQSSDYVRTTHVGSLARQPDVANLILARERGEAYDEAEFQRAVRSAVETVVRQQVEIGLDTVSDGEQSKSSFNNYMTERLSGFERRDPGPSGAVSWSGSRERNQYPEFYEWYGRQVGQPLSPPAVFVCTGPVTYRGLEALQRDIANLMAAVTSAGSGEPFMPSVAIGSVAASRPNEY
jgi:5-methyltetrahydropteroyltriglutamate--homocysteine methyltransferase